MQCPLQWLLLPTSGVGESLSNPVQGTKRTARVSTLQTQQPFTISR